MTGTTAGEGRDSGTVIFPVCRVSDERYDPHASIYFLPQCDIVRVFENGGAPLSSLYAVHFARSGCVLGSGVSLLEH